MFGGQPKYVNLMAVVKAALSVSHGQADVERGFSLNKHIVSPTRVSLKHQTVVALRTVKDVVSRYESVDKVTVSPQLLRQYRAAHAAYNADVAAADAGGTEQDKQKKEKAEAEQLKLDTEKKRSDIVRKQREAEQLVAEATTRLTKAAATQNIGDILAA